MIELIHAGYIAATVTPEKVAAKIEEKLRSENAHHQLETKFDSFIAGLNEAEKDQIIREKSSISNIMDFHFYKAAEVEICDSLLDINNYHKQLKHRQIWLQ